MVACGQSHTAACSRPSGELFTWGYNLCFRLGHGDVVEKTSPKLVEALRDTCIALVSCGGSHTAACTSDGALYTWGAGEQGQLGHGDLSNRQVPCRVEQLAGQSVTMIACGQTHSAAIVSPGTLFTWGHGMHGRLGHGHTDRLATPTTVRLLCGTTVTSVACGQSHTAAVNDCGLVFTWGDGFDGQLGHGPRDACHVPKHVASLLVEHNAEVHPTPQRPAHQPVRA
jgi:alpha-tubulin suppressor-like RCC1 family protein